MSNKIVLKVGEFKVTKRFRDRTGYRNGHIEVLRLAGRNKHSQAVWECCCHACGKESFLVCSGDVNRNNSCGCGKWNTNKLSKHPHHQKGKNSPYWTGHGDISGYRFANIKKSASERNLSFSITIEQIWDLYTQQAGRCALTGLEIGFGEKARDLASASLDRIDSSKGYEPGNVHWVHKRVNVMKMDLDLEEFMGYCKLITEHRSVQDG
tara:strand:+ start:367 stop:993 length:627 start_codon:yes stop_codon:yes gene_type:complete